MADELKPCPFCGGAASIVYSSGNEVYNKQWSVGCTLCSVQFSAIGSNSWRSVKEEDDAAQAKSIAAWNRRALSHAAGQEVDSRDETLRVFREMAGKVHGMFFWRVSPDSKGNHSISHEAVQAVVDLCQEIEQGTPAYENLTPAVASSEAAPPTTSAEVGQDGEQCRAASGEPDAWLYEYEHDGESDHCLSRVRFLPSWVEAKRATEHPLYLRALSRGVPEGFPGELDTLRAFAVEQHEAFDRYCAAIAAQRDGAATKEVKQSGSFDETYSNATKSIATCWRCSGPGRVSFASSDNERENEWRVVCDRCSADSGPEASKSMSAAIEAWNDLAAQRKEGE